jgi:hypothetical protein
MEKIKQAEVVERIESGEVRTIMLRGLQNGKFCMLLRTDEGWLIHQTVEGEVKEYPFADHALRWLKRKTKVKEITINIELWQEDKCKC